MLPVPPAPPDEDTAPIPKLPPDAVYVTAPIVKVVEVPDVPLRLKFPPVPPTPMAQV